MSGGKGVVARIVRGRSRLPSWVDRVIEHVAEHPGGLAARVVSALLGRGERPAPAPALGGAPRVYIGATNYAAQGWLWARALEQARPGLSAWNVEVEIPGGFGFAADGRVPIGVYRHDRVWQAAERDAVVAGFTHVIIEAFRPLFGDLYGFDTIHEIAALREAGLGVAIISHGTDLRDPDRHLDRHPWSPYRDDPRIERLRREAAASRRVLAEAGVPVFVSTPDLLDEAEGVVWCPVVVDADRWRQGPLLRRPQPVVAHVPSMTTVKGTQLIEPSVRALADEGLIEYRRLTGVPAAAMPALLADVDIVLDQFRLGSYGVGACEALAAGRIVVGHVRDEVRARVRTATGLELPIVEADADSIGTVLRGILRDPGAAAAIASRGPAFVRAVHDGRMSADALLSGWIEPRGAVA